MRKKNKKEKNFALLDRIIPYTLALAGIYMVVIILVKLIIGWLN